MNFLDEITKMISGDTNLTTNYKYVNLDGKHLYVEGIKGISQMGQKEIVFMLNKKQITIKGDDLLIKYFDKSTALIDGRIITVTVL